MTVQQVPFPGVVYLMPRLYDQSGMVLWEETDKKDLIVLKVPPKVYGDLKFYNFSVVDKVKAIFKSKVKTM